MIGWDALTSTDAPLVGTFHCYSESVPPHKVAALLGARRRLNHLTRRIAVSEAAAWTGRRFYGGEYTIVPNGVELPEGGVPAPRLRAPGEPLEIAFVGQAVERKGLPILLRAFEALREHVDVAAHDRRRERARGRAAAGRARRHHRARPRLRRAQAPRARVRPRAGRAVAGRRVVRHGPHRGASRPGRPVVASDIAGYRDVVRDGVDGVLFPRGDAQQLAELLRGLAHEPGAHARARRRRRRERRALRLAEGRRAGHRGLRGGPGGARSPRARWRARRAHRHALRRPGAPHARRAGCRRSSRRCRAATAPAPRCAGACWAPRRIATRRRLVHGAGAHRRRPHRPLAARLEPGLGARRARADVPVDGLPRRLLARDPQGRAARRCGRGSSTPGRARRSAS